MNCGNNTPRDAMASGDRAAVDAFAAYLELAYARDHGPGRLSPEQLEAISKYEQGISSTPLHP